MAHEVNTLRHVKCWTVLEKPRDNNALPSVLFFRKEKRDTKNSKP